MRTSPSIRALQASSSIRSSRAKSASCRVPRGSGCSPAERRRPSLTPSSRARTWRRDETRYAGHPAIDAGSTILPRTPRRRDDRNRAPDAIYEHAREFAVRRHGTRRREMYGDETYARRRRYNARHRRRRHGNRRGRCRRRHTVHRRSPRSEVPSSATSADSTRRKARPYPPSSRSRRVASSRISFSCATRRRSTSCACRSF
jgi:hypothetical protein